MKRITKKKYQKKEIFIIIVVLILLTPLVYIFTHNYINKPRGNENITTKLKNDTDFLSWFIDFDTLYRHKVSNPEYQLTKTSFENINHYLNDTKKTNIYLENNIYHIEDTTTLELDTSTRSLRYIKYYKNKPIETLEIRLLHGKYYVQLLNNEYLYKITFNKNTKKITKKKNKDNSLSITSSIYRTDTFNW